MFFDGYELFSTWNLYDEIISNTHVPTAQFRIIKILSIKSKILLYTSPVSAPAQSPGNLLSVISLYIYGVHICSQYTAELFFFFFFFILMLYDGSGITRDTPMFFAYYWPARSFAVFLHPVM